MAGLSVQVDRTCEALTLYFVLSISLALILFNCNDHNKSCEPW